MTNEFIVWGNGVKDVSGEFLRDNNYKIIEGTWHKNIDNIFVKDECIMYLVQGEIYKEGKLKFEKKESYNKNQNETNSEITLVNLISDNYKSDGSFTTKEVVTDIAWGDNHILIQTQQGNLYTWGDNAYGQLGLGKSIKLNGKVFEPHQIKIEKVKKIFAYKDNSFAIDGNDKLWAWGKSEFLGSNFKGDAFEPTQILSEYATQSFKINNDRIIVSVIKDKFKNSVKSDTNLKHKNSNNPNNKEAIELVDTSAKPNFSKILNAEQASNRNNLSLTSIIKIINEDVSNAIFKLNTDNYNLSKLRAKVLSDTSTIKQIGLEKIWEEINNILYQSPKINKKYAKNNQTLITLADTIDIFAATLNSIISGTFREFKIEKLVENFIDYEKEVNKIISEMQTHDSNDDENISNFAVNIQTLLLYFIKYKKIESLVHKMSAHQFLMKSYKFENVMESLKFILEKDENVEKKLYLIEKSFESLKILIQKTSDSLIETENLFENLSQINFTNEDTNVEKFIHKYIIESTIYIKDLWLLLISHVETERKAKVKEQHMIKIIDKYKELYSIQLYLRSVSLKNAFVNDTLDNVINLDNLDVTNKILLQLTEIHGIIFKLESFMNERLDENEDFFSKELIIMYATSLLDNAYQKKIMLEIIYSIEKKKLGIQK